MNQEFSFDVGIKHRFSVLTDNKTGVQYLVFYHNEYSVSVCPRYNSDGTFYNAGRCPISKEEYLKRKKRLEESRQKKQKAE